jgi:hypothetical protein
MTSQAYRYARLLYHYTGPGPSHLHPVIATVWISRPRTTNWQPGSCYCTIRIAMSPQRIRLRSLEIVWLIPSLDRGMPRYRGSRRSCPPIPGKTQSPADQLRPVMAAMQSARVRVVAGDRCVESEEVMRLRATSRYLHHNWFPFHRHAVILHRDQALSNCRK